MCACLCGAYQQRREAVPQYRRALALPLQYFCAPAILLVYWPDQPLARFESRFACGLSNCGSAVQPVLQSCNFICTTDQHSKREDRVRRTIQETLSDTAKCAINPLTLANYVLSSSCQSNVSESGEGRRICGVEGVFTSSLIHKQGYAISENLPIFHGKVPP